MLSFNCSFLPLGPTSQIWILESVACVYHFHHQHSCFPSSDFDSVAKEARAWDISFELVRHFQGNHTKRKEKRWDSPIFWTRWVHCHCDVMHLQRWNVAQLCNVCRTGGRFWKVPVDPCNSDQLPGFVHGQSKSAEQLCLRKPCPPLQPAN